MEEIYTKELGDFRNLFNECDEHIKGVLDNALEHASHGWNALEKEKEINRIDPDAWPPKIKSMPGTSQYHFAAMISYVYEAFQGVCE